MRRETPGAESPGGAESGAASHSLDGVCSIQEVSEGSLPPTGWAIQATSRAGEATRGGDIIRVWDWEGGGWGVLAGGNS